MDKRPAPFEVSRTGDVEVVRLIEPKLAQPDLEALQNDLSKRIDEGARKMVINLAPVAFVDSFGIGVIAATARRISQAGGRVKLCGVGDRVKMSLTITRLDRMLEIFADEEEALRSFGAKA
jgi:anti-sigma B factor antagonist